MQALELTKENELLKSRLEQQPQTSISLDLSVIPGQPSTEQQLHSNTSHLENNRQQDQLDVQEAEQEPNANEAPSSSGEGPSQPPVDSLPTIIDKPHVFEFGDKEIRKTLETPQRVSVYDLIVAISDDANPRTTLSRLKKKYASLVAFCYSYKFADQSQTPVTDAQGAVMIMNLLPGHKAAEFRVACAGIIVRYLGGDESLVGEIKRNQVVQETAPETNPVRLFGNAISSSIKFHETSSLQLASVTNIIDFRSPQVYARQVFDRVSDVHPVGRPQDVVSPEQLAELAVVKIGSQGNNTGRQMTHITTSYDRSKLLDSKLTNSYTHVEAMAKDNWKNNGELFEGLFEGKASKDTELLLVRNQHDYERQLSFYHQLCPLETTSLELQLAQEKSKQAEAEARKAEADARKIEAQANADARKVEADARVRIAQAELELLKFKIAHGIRID